MITKLSVAIITLVLFAGASFASEAVRAKSNTGTSPASNSTRAEDGSKGSDHAQVSGPEAGEQIDWQVISGGGTAGASLNYAMLATTGQTAAGPGSSAGYFLNSGYWQVFEMGGGTCCLQPTVGDVDQSGGVDITDVSVLIDNQFLTLTPLVCEVEGDVDNSSVVDITDLSILIDNQFLTLTPLPSCP